MTAISRQTSLGHITFQQREIQEQAFALARKHLNASNELYGSFEIIGRGSYSVTLLHEDEERSYPVLFQTGRTLFTVNGILHAYAGIFVHVDSSKAYTPTQAICSHQFDMNEIISNEAPTQPRM